MGEINENIAKNIQKLRKINGWKQSELADKLNYTDKTISKWERGESVPDVEMLAHLSDIFNVSLDYLIKPHSDLEIENSQTSKSIFVRNLLLAILCCVSVYFIASILFTLAAIRNPESTKQWWVIFIYAIPACSLIIYIYGIKSNYWLVQLISLSVFVWTLITSFYCSTMILELSNFFWLLFIIGAPLEGAICLYFFWKRKLVKK